MIDLSQREDIQEWLAGETTRLVAEHLKRDAKAALDALLAAAATSDDPRVIRAFERWRGSLSAASLLSKGTTHVNDHSGD